MLASRCAGVVGLVTALTMVAACASAHRGDTTTAAGPGTSTTTTRVSAARPSEPNTPGDIPDSQTFIAFTAPDGSFTVHVPEGWARTDAPGGATFTDNFNTIAIESRTGTTAPTAESARSTELPALAAADPSFKPGDVSTVDRAGGQAILITFTRDSPPSPVTGKVTRLAGERYEFFRDGRTVQLTLAGPVGADNVDPWREVTDSFRWLQ
jgi:hypothetical protein